MTGEKLKALEGRLRKAAEQLRANGKLTTNQEKHLSLNY